MKELTTDEILKRFKNKELTPQLQVETNQVYAFLKVDDREFSLFARIFDGKNLLQLIAFFPKQTSPKSITDTARLLHLFNKELDIPGFGMDEGSKIVFFRCMIPTFQGKLDSEVFDSFYNSLFHACKHFAAPIEAVSSGEISFEDFLKKTVEKQKSNKNK